MLAILYFSIQLASGNGKTGVVVTTKATRATCPISCAYHPSRHGVTDKGNSTSPCYGEGIRIAPHWSKLGAGISGKSWQALTFDRYIYALKASVNSSSFVRGREVGDGIPSDGDPARLCPVKNVKEAKAIGRAGVAFSYTHYNMGYKDNTQTVKTMSKHGYTVNASSDSIDEALTNHGLGLPTVIVTSPIDVAKVEKHNGVKFVMCPASYHGQWVLGTRKNKAGKLTGPKELREWAKGRPEPKKVQCVGCGNGSPLCDRADRDYVIKFPAHGPRKNAIVDAQKAKRDQNNLLRVVA